MSASATQVSYAEALSQRVTGENEIDYAVGEAGQRMPWLRRGLQMYAKELKCRGDHCLRARRSVADVERPGR
jgi:hypothetical protein